MKIGVLGTGIVGQTIGGKLIENGHHVMMGARAAQNEKAEAWRAKFGPNAAQGTFEQAAIFGDLLFNCTKGEATMEVLKLSGRDNLKGKVLIDISNPLDFSKGMPPSLFICNTRSLAEDIQETFPDTLVVKTLNTMNCRIMVDPSIVKENHDVFISGNNAEAKKTVKQLLKDDFGWMNIIDLGDITTARGTEMLLPVWLRIWGALGTADFNFHIAR